jgi:hypothetical protein
MQKLLADGLNPTIAPSKFFAFEFKGKFARFQFCASSITIAIDRSIFLLTTADGSKPANFKKTVTGFLPRKRVDDHAARRAKIGRANDRGDGRWNTELALQIYTNSDRIASLPGNHMMGTTTESSARSATS